MKRLFLRLQNEGSLLETGTMLMTRNVRWGRDETATVAGIAAMVARWDEMLLPLSAVSVLSMIDTVEYELEPFASMAIDQQDGRQLPP